MATKTGKHFSDAQRVFLDAEYDKYPPGVRPPREECKHIAERCEKETGKPISPSSVGRYMAGSIKEDRGQKRLDRKTPDQRSNLLASFYQNPYPFMGTVIMLAHENNLGVQTTRHWFDDRRKILRIRGGSSGCIGPEMRIAYEEDPNGYYEKLVSGKIDLMTGAAVRTVPVDPGRVAYGPVSSMSAPGQTQYGPSPSGQSGSQNISNQKSGSNPPSQVYQHDIAASYPAQSGPSGLVPTLANQTLVDFETSDPGQLFAGCIFHNDNSTSQEDSQFSFVSDSMQQEPNVVADNITSGQLSSFYPDTIAGNAIPRVDAEALQNQMKLERLRAETAKVEAAIKNNLQYKQKLAEEMQRLSRHLASDISTPHTTTRPQI